MDIQRHPKRGLQPEPDFRWTRGAGAGRGGREPLGGGAGLQYLPAQLEVPDPTHPGADEGWVGQEGHGAHGVSREVRAHGTEDDEQEGSGGAGDTQRGLRGREGPQKGESGLQLLPDPGVWAPSPARPAPPRSERRPTSFPRSTGRM